MTGQNIEKPGPRKLCRLSAEAGSEFTLGPRGGRQAAWGSGHTAGGSVGPGWDAGTGLDCPGPQVVYTAENAKPCPASQGVGLRGLVGGGRGWGSVGREAGDVDLELRCCSSSKAGMVRDGDT